MNALITPLKKDILIRPPNFFLGIVMNIVPSSQDQISDAGNDVL
jgi:hypothetical protein